MNVSRKLAVILGCSLFAACGNSNETKTDKPADTTAAAPAAAAAAPNTKALELIGASDCTTCHRLHQADPGAAIGPAYSEVAKKYAPAADSTVTRLVNKIATGGSGVWGAVPMTPHPALPKEDIKTIVTYIMTLK